jgi:hypothetical protein
VSTFSVKPNIRIAMNAATDRNRQRQAGDDRGAPRVEKQEHDEHGQQPAEHQRDLHVFDRLADERGVVTHQLQRYARRQLWLHLRHGLAHAVGHAHVFAPACFCTSSAIAGRSLTKASLVGSSTPSITLPSTSRTSTGPIAEAASPGCHQSGRRTSLEPSTRTIASCRARDRRLLPEHDVCVRNASTTWTSRQPVPTRAPCDRTTT